MFDFDFFELLVFLFDRNQNGRSSLAPCSLFLFCFHCCNWKCFPRKKTILPISFAYHKKQPICCGNRALFYTRIYYSYFYLCYLFISIFQVLYVQLLVFVFLIWKGLRKLFFGQLRQPEIEVSNLWFKEW